MEKYCKLYVHSLNKKIVEDAIKSSIILMNLTEDNVFFYIDENDEKNTKKALKDETGFLYYNYIVDIDSESLIIEQIIAFVDNVMKFLVERNIKVVASCDYEDNLQYFQ